MACLFSWPKQSKNKLGIVLSKTDPEGMDYEYMVGERRQRIDELYTGKLWEIAKLDIEIAQVIASQSSLKHRQIGSAGNVASAQGSDGQLQDEAIFINILPQTLIIGLDSTLEGII
ncbi:hypothetical protein CEXT_468351 [Caerostris extrusa]|uniref:Uncharacterized protein n=1 Tax=Caerostris extrusa TaxID=172846 RepID=A0AAV4W0B1_CAEEX|nr:hypothetical protein CEXT_468351 [Caerostris extrusa]